MKPLRITDNLLSISDFKPRASEIMGNLTHQPLVITQNGKAAGVLMSPSAYDSLMASEQSFNKRRQASDLLVKTRAARQDSYR